LPFAVLELPFAGLELPVSVSGSVEQKQFHLPFVEQLDQMLFAVVGLLFAETAVELVVSSDFLVPVS
tara:strand:- start:140 stop:340 length:201 start_codon:yes stop_codon:yes gene_type:complete